MTADSLRAELRQLGQLVEGTDPDGRCTAALALSRPVCLSVRQAGATPEAALRSLLDAVAGVLVGASPSGAARDTRGSNRGEVGAQGRGVEAGYWPPPRSVHDRLYGA